MIKQFIQSAGRGIKNAAKLGKQKSLLFLPGRFGKKNVKNINEQSDIEVNQLQTEGVENKKPKTISKPSVRKSRKREKWQLGQFQVEPADGKVRFHDIGLSLSIMHAIADLGFQYCTPIQALSLPHLLKGKDLIGHANTGTGKTAVFLAAILEKLLAQGKIEPKKKVKALIIAPTRELVMQIAKDGQGLTKYCHLRIAAIYGGADYKGQMALLREKKCDIVVATPGRLLDFLGKNVVSLKECGILVIDEADRMLDMGFIPDVRRIVHRLPNRSERQTLMFSATVTDEVKMLASQWCNEPVSVDIEPEQVAVETVSQKVYLVTTSEKYHVLYNLLQKHGDSKIAVFTNQKNEARKLNDRLRRNGVNCTLLTGDVPQKKREDRLERFRAGTVKVLVATDVAGRGIHIEGISHVVNYTLPYEPEDYVHRIGRTGRAGAAGEAISFACEEGSFYLPEIEEFIGRKLDCVVPEEELLIAPPKGSARGGGSSEYRKRGGGKGNSYRPRGKTSVK
jgi:ATP-dependent RNA helicase RhlB